MVRVILIDDEVPALDELEYILTYQENIEVIGVYTDPVDGLNGVINMHPDIVFLDIQMPQLDGLSLAEELIILKIDTEIVYVTAYDQYALSAFEKNALDYILKPFSQKRILKTIERIQKKIKYSQNIDELINKLESARSNKIKVNKIPIWKNDKINLVDIENVLYCKVCEGEVYIITLSDKYITNFTLSQLEKRFMNHNFLRTHRSYLVNLNYIKEIIPWFNNTYILRVVNKDEEIPISRKYIKELKRIFEF